MGEGIKNHSVGTIIIETFISYPSTRCTQGAIGRDGHRVQEAGVTNVVCLQLAVSQVPHLGAKNRKTIGQHTIPI